MLTQPMAATAAPPFPAPSRAAQRGPNAQPFPAPTPGAGPLDTADLSAATYERYALHARLDTFSVIYDSPAQGRTKTLAEVGQDLQANLADYEELLGGLLRETKVDPATELVLQADGKGHVNVVEDHPDGRAVETLFAENSVLVSRFMVMAARASILHAAETHPTFQQDYQANARGAIEEHIDVLEEHLFDFQLRVQDGELATAFA